MKKATLMSTIVLHRTTTATAEDYIAAMSSWQQGYETEEIFHEEDPLRVLRRLEAEGWSKNLFPAWVSSKVNEGELNKLRDLVGQGVQFAHVRHLPMAVALQRLVGPARDDVDVQVEHGLARGCAVELGDHHPVRPHLLPQGRPERGQLNLGVLRFRAMSAPFFSLCMPLYNPRINPADAQARRRAILRTEVMMSFRSGRLTSRPLR